LPRWRNAYNFPGKCARAANLALDRRGRFWEREYFDTLIRDGQHLKRAIRYTENNPVKASLVAERKAWRWGSARWRAEGQRVRRIYRGAGHRSGNRTHTEEKENRIYFDWLISSRSCGN